MKVDVLLQRSDSSFELLIACAIRQALFECIGLEQLRALHIAQSPEDDGYSCWMKGITRG